MTKSVTCPEELGGLASQVTVDYSQLAQQGRLAAATAEPEEVRIRPASASTPTGPVIWEMLIYTHDNRHADGLNLTQTLDLKEQIT